MKHKSNLDFLILNIRVNYFVISCRASRGVSHSQRRIIRQREHVLRRLRETPLSFCLRVIVNEFHSNLEKTTSSVLSVIFN